MKKILLVSSFTLLILVLLSIGPDAPADGPDQAAEEPQPAETPESTEPLETFEPTEKLSADSAVSFPVDI